MKYVNKINYKFFPLLLSLLFLFSCSTIKKSNINNYQDVNISNYDELVQISNNRFSEINNISGKISLELKLKNENINSNAHFICNKNEAIRITLIPFPFIEVARIWFNRDGVYIWDKINSAKIEESYASISSRLGIEINYQMIESFFLGDVFTKNISPQNNRIKYCKRNEADNGYSLEGESFNMLYKFLFNNSALPSEICIRSDKSTNKLIIKSNGYQSINDKYILPIKQDISLNNYDKDIFRLSIDYQSIDINTSNKLNTNVNMPSNLTRVDLTDISKFFN